MPIRNNQNFYLIEEKKTYFLAFKKVTGKTMLEYALLVGGHGIQYLLVMGNASVHPSDLGDTYMEEFNFISVKLLLILT